jgi:hypothetical protein
LAVSLLLVSLLYVTLFLRRSQPSLSPLQYLVYGRPDENASDTGFSITMAVTFSGMILWWVRVLNEFEGK